MVNTKILSPLSTNKKLHTTHKCRGTMIQSPSAGATNQDRTPPGSQERLYAPVTAWKASRGTWRPGAPQRAREGLSEAMTSHRRGMARDQDRAVSMIIWQRHDDGGVAGHRPARTCARSAGTCTRVRIAHACDVRASRATELHTYAHTPKGCARVCTTNARTRVGVCACTCARASARIPRVCTRAHAYAYMCAQVRARMYRACAPAHAHHVRLQAHTVCSCKGSCTSSDVG